MLPAFRLLLRGPEIGFSRQTIAIIVLIGLASTALEAAALLIFVPIVQLIQADGDTAKLISQSQAWSYLARATNFAGLPLTVPVLLFVSFMAFLARQIALYYGGMVLARTRHVLGAQLRQDLFSLAIHSRLDALDREPVGHVVNAIAGEIDRATKGLVEAASFLSRMIVGLGYAGVLLWISIPFTVVGVATYGVAGLCLRHLMRQSASAGEAIVAGYQSVTEFLITRLRAVRLIRLSGTERAEQGALDHIVSAQRDQLISFERLRAQLSMIVEPIVVGVSFLVVGIGYSLLNLRLEEIGLFLLIMLRLMPVVLDLLKTQQSVLAVQASVDTFLNMRRDFTNSQERHTGKKPLDGVDCDIVFQDVTLVYPNRDRPALDRVNIEFPMASVCALVGPSGAGKSSLIDLLPALRQPTSGRILLAGVPLENYDIAALRRAIGYLPQSSQLFDVTVADHIRYGNPSASDDEVVNSAKLAGAHDFILAMPKGYATQLGDSGGRLSGGQRQRIDLARALAGKPRILVLDEPTSHLDADTEDLFRRTLRRIQTERSVTVIIVGHRLSTVRAADKIYVMNAGRVVESGNHAALVAVNGWYAGALRKQGQDGNSLVEEVNA